MKDRASSDGWFAAILLCFFLSGAAGLIYQVAWGKALGLVFGHTVYAIGTVLAVFMGGLAAGSSCLGKWSEKRSHPIRLYGWIELGVAATGALSLAGLAGVRSLYFAAYPWVSGSPALLLALRFLGAAMVLFLPTFLMGGTLPVLVRGLARSSAQLGARVSRLYWVNTLGAVAGTLAAGFWLLPELGLRRTVACAATLNLTAGAVTLLLSRSLERVAADRREISSSGTETPEFSGAPVRFVLAAFGVVGATAIAYEIAWTRLLATMVGSSTYAFTLMLATFLAGMVLGSALFERWLARGGRVSLATFSCTQTWTAAAALLFLVFFQQIPNVVPPILKTTHQSFGGLVVAQFVTSALAMLPAALVFGFNFPAVLILAAGTRREGAGYAANTLGAIVAAVATGFWLVPRIGSFRVVALMAGFNLLLAIVLGVGSATRRVRTLAWNLALCLFTFFAGWSSLFYNRALAAYSTVLYWNHHEANLTPAESAETTDLLFVADGLNASIAVARTEDYLALRTNGKVDASTGDTPTQLLLGHLGAALHPAPRRVLIIGFGSGMTASAVARYPDVERIDCVEIEPAVLQAAAFLEKLNRGVLRDPRMHVHLDDARNFLLTTRERYDLIISEPSNPWIAGVASLFTDEYYRAARERLAPGGMLVQWVQSYSLDPADLRMIFATLAPHFPEVTLWHSVGPDLIVLARLDRQPLRFDRMRSLWNNSALQEDFTELDLRAPEAFPAYYLLDDDALRRLASGSARNTDDRTLLEYHAPRTLLNRSLADRTKEMIERYRKRLLPANLDPAEERASLEATAESLFEMEEAAAAVRYVNALEKEPATAHLEVLRGRALLAQNRGEEAVKSFASAVRLEANSLDALYWLAEGEHNVTENTSAERHLAQILQRDPNFLPALSLCLKMAEERQDWSAASTLQIQSIAATEDPSAEEFCRLGEFLLRQGRNVECEKALLEGIQKDPYSFACHRNLGEMYRSKNRWAEARRHLEMVVHYFPDGDAGTYLSLAAVYRALGMPREAVAGLRKGRRIFPDDADLRRALPEK